MGKPARKIGYIQRMSLMHRLKEHDLQIQAVIKTLSRENAEINSEQLEGILITLSNALDTLLNE